MTAHQQNQPPPALAREAVMTRKPHHPECLCEHCERTGGGIWAQRAVLAGDSAAARHLSKAVYEVLSAERAKRLVARKPAPLAFLQRSPRE